MINRYGQRYITAKDFANWYFNVGMPKGTHPSTESDVFSELEYYEEHRILFPALRLTLPQRYAADCWKALGWRQQKEKFEFPPKDWPPEWLVLRNYLTEVDAWNWYDSPTIIHPYERWREFGEYFVEPISVPFRKWSSMSVSVEDDSGSCETDTSENYYHYWHAYLLDAIRRENQITIHGCFGIDDHYQLAHDRMLPRSTFRVSSGRYYLVRHAELKESTGLFSCLSQYICRCQREWRICVEENKRKEGWREIVPELYVEQYHAKCQEHALECQGGRKKDLKEWVAFTRMLTILWHEYNRHGISGLESVVKRDIKHAVDFIESAYAQTFADVRSELAYSPLGYTKHILDVIFPNKYEDAREDGLDLICSRLAKYNEITERTAHLSKDDIKRLCKYLEGAGLETLFFTASGLYSNMRDADWAYAHQLMGFLRNLCIVAEDFAKHICANCEDSRVRNRYNGLSVGNATLPNTLKLLFAQNASWWQFLKTNNVPVSPEDFDKRIEALLAMQSSSDRDKADPIVSDLLILIATRNFTSHGVKVNERVFKQHYMEILDAVLRSFLHLWFWCSAYGHLTIHPLDETSL